MLIILAEIIEDVTAIAIACQDELALICDKDVLAVCFIDDSNIRYKKGIATLTLDYYTKRIK